MRAGGGDSQVPWGVKALDGRVSHPAWRGKPTWYLVAKDDRMIPPDAQHFVSKRANATVVESKGSQSPVEHITNNPSFDLAIAFALIAGVAVFAGCAREGFKARPFQKWETDVTSVPGSWK